MIVLTVCPSSGVDDCVILYPCVGMCRGCTNLKSLFVFFISLLVVAQHDSGNRVSIIWSWRLRNVIALYWYVPLLNKLDVTFVSFIFLLIVAQHVSGNRKSINKS